MNPHITKLLKDLSLVEDPDITIKANDGEVKAHSVLLKARSPVFRAMLNSGMKEACEKVIKMETYSKHTIGELIKYITFAKVYSCYDTITTCELYEIADQYELLELKDELFKRLMEISEVLWMAKTMLSFTLTEELRVKCLNTIVTAIRSNKFEAKDFARTKRHIKIMIFDYLVKADPKTVGVVNPKVDPNPTN